MNGPDSKSLTMSGRLGPRLLSAIAGAGMIAASILTIEHFFAANYPATIFEGAFCDISAFFNCDSSAYAPIAQIFGVPLGYPGLVLGALVLLALAFPSPAFERTNKFLALVNGLGVVGLFLYSVFGLHSICLLCSGYYVFSLLSLFAYWRFGIDRGERGFLARWGRPSVKHLAVFAVLGLTGAYGFRLYHDAKKEAQTGTTMQIVSQYFELPRVAWPSAISPFRTTSAAAEFEAAPIRIVVYADFLCPDCRHLARQLEELEEEFGDRMNVAFQFFPLEAACNGVVDKDLHPGACELARIAAAVDPASFRAIHDEIYDNMAAARDPLWRRELALRHGAERALEDPALAETVRRYIDTGAEYEKTSERFAHGIRSTPTMILNNRMVIGTLPTRHLRAIFQALVEAAEGGGRRFIESWVPAGKK